MSLFSFSSSSSSSCQPSSSSPFSLGSSASPFGSTTSSTGIALGSSLFVSANPSPSSSFSFNLSSNSKPTLASSFSFGFSTSSSSSSAPTTSLSSSLSSFPSNLSSNSKPTSAPSFGFTFSTSSSSSSAPTTSLSSNLFSSNSSTASPLFATHLFSSSAPAISTTVAAKPTPPSPLFSTVTTSNALTPSAGTTVASSSASIASTTAAFTTKGCFTGFGVATTAASSPSGSTGSVPGFTLSAKTSVPALTSQAESTTASIFIQTEGCDERAEPSNEYDQDPIDQQDEAQSKDADKTSAHTEEFDWAKFDKFFATEADPQGTSQAGPVAAVAPPLSEEKAELACIIDENLTVLAQFKHSGADFLLDDESVKAVSDAINFLVEHLDHERIPLGSKAQLWWLSTEFDPLRRKFGAARALIDSHNDGLTSARSLNQDEAALRQRGRELLAAGKEMQEREVAIALERELLLARLRELEDLSTATSLSLINNISLLKERKSTVVKMNAERVDLERKMQEVGPERPQAENDVHYVSQVFTSFFASLGF